MLGFRVRGFAGFYISQQGAKDSPLILIPSMMPGLYAGGLAELTHSSPAGMAWDSTSMCRSQPQTSNFHGRSEISQPLPNLLTESGPQTAITTA